MKRAFGALLFILAGCGSSGKLCNSSLDCISPEVCTRGECRLLLPGEDAGNLQKVDAGFLEEEDAGSGPTPDAGLTEPDAGTPADAGVCGPPTPGNPVIRRRCAPATDRECDGVTDSALRNGGVPEGRLNQASGNGFDDDCDGLVDEGCSCDGNGLTKECFLVPATQVDATTGKPVGWCAANAKGSLDCSGGELASWSGVCRGAQPPRLSDTCATGDFNCDGLDKNNALEGCNCPAPITCPTQAVTLAPYPDSRNLPAIDGNLWVTDVAKRSQTTNWKWTILGGDCDNVLPSPTFALYSQKDATVSSARKGTRTPVKLDLTQSPPKYVASTGAPLAALVASNYGSGLSGGKIYPAFGLSGDYIVQGEFTLDGKNFYCTQKVQVRAPGIRAELCWDSVGRTDLDLHFARLQGITCGSQGWNTHCASNGALQDCYHLAASGCVSSSPQGPNWGYGNSTDSACFGWSSKRSQSGAQRCTNPRLDRDNISCTRTETNPTDVDFCGPENINLDNPRNNDRFVVGINHYGASGAAAAKPHVNLYCNGERVLSVGYNPATGQTAFPLLNTPGQDATGDFWTVATVKARVNASNQLTGCDIDIIPSRRSDPVRDGPGGPGGGNNVCVDHGYRSKAFVETATGQGLTPGAQPQTAAQWCKH